MAKRKTRKYCIMISREHGPESVQVDGTPVELPGMEEYSLFIHRKINRDWHDPNNIIFSKNEYQISEVRTGKGVCSYHGSKKSVVNHCATKIAVMTKERIRRDVNYALEYDGEVVKNNGTCSIKKR